jgi:predicted protein tyrosine phosphatase
MLPSNFKIVITGQYSLSDFKEYPVTDVISFTHPGNEEQPDLSFFPKADALKICVHDSFTVNDRLDGHHMPDEAMVKSIVDKALSIKERVKNGEEVFLVCHCFAGVSRSTAAAYILLCILLGRGREQYAHDHLVRIRKCAYPNPLMLAYGEKILGQTLTEPLRKSGRLRKTNIAI